MKKIFILTMFFAVVAMCHAQDLLPRQAPTDSVYDKVNSDNYALYQTKEDTILNLSYVLITDKNILYKSEDVLSPNQFKHDNINMEEGKIYDLYLPTNEYAQQRTVRKYYRIVYNPSSLLIGNKEDFVIVTDISLENEVGEVFPAFKVEHISKNNTKYYNETFVININSGYDLESFEELDDYEWLLTTKGQKVTKEINNSIKRGLKSLVK